jgi:hypothetical protein
MHSPRNGEDEAACRSRFGLRDAHLLHVPHDEDETEGYGQLVDGVLDRALHFPLCSAVPSHQLM